MNAVLRQADPRSFLVLPENQLSIAAVNQLAPGVKRRCVNLVTLIGEAGTGKSHLARELVRSWEGERTDKKVIVVTASQFSAQFAEAATIDSIPQFQTRYRNEIALLVCEDIQMLGARKETQQQLQATIDDVISQGGLVLLTSTQMPGAIRGLSRRLMNRMHGGLCVTIEMPSVPSRRKLIEHILAGEGHHLSTKEIDQIAQDYPVSPRELSGLLAQLRAEEKLLSPAQRPRRSTVKALIEERNRVPSIDLGGLCKLTAVQFGVKSADLKGPRRSQTISLARQTAMYLAREQLQMNYVEIGKYFNRGNHSTVIHACRKIGEQRQTDPDLDLAIQSICDVLTPAGIRS
ncbi:helix-turn-helix domain-containing protein [Planctomicrobium sp. SH527]|uniref:helix-turn-helix domain-containing protein n=1 Tax=Planctomicrobium sp. SH527 TaxID=3448123 RepID=UPI003F5C8E47